MKLNNGKLAYFPAVYPGELLYSVLARYHLHVGKPGPMHTVETLFGNRNVIATFDLPGHLQSLADRIPPERGLSVDRIIETLTLFPYFTAFVPPILQVKARLAMCRGTTDGLHMRLGLSAFRIGRNQRLRFCSECVHMMQAMHSELWWRRDHQLPGVMVCPEHGCLLLESNVSFSQFSRHEFVAATPENCPMHAPPVIPVVNHTCLDHLQRVAQRSSELLSSPPEARTLLRWTTAYRSQMVEVGLAKSSATMDQHSFDVEFRKYFEQSLHLLPSVMDGNNFAGDWLASMVRKHRKASHPLYHVLVQDFLTHRQAQASPFGSGPWPCINPLASHSSKLPIKMFTQHQNAGNRVAVFSCTCGYVYTRCLNSKTGVLGASRFSCYGPLLEPVLRQLITLGNGLREIGRFLRLDPKTVVRLASELGIRTAWKQNSFTEQKTKLSIVIPSPEAINSNFHQTVSPTSAIKQPSNHSRIDWRKIDNDWLIKLRTVISVVIQVIPPVRVTVAELERRVSGRGWLLKRRHHLPQTIALLEQSIETTHDFQLRRIQWAIAELEVCGAQVKAWRVMRKAGLPSNCLKRINSVLDGTYALSRRTA